MKRAYWKREKLIDYQDKKLRKTVKYAYENSSFYHRKFKEVGVSPEDVRTVEDLNKLPIVRKEELKKNLSEVVSKKFDVANLKVLRTSGSTGRPLHVCITEAENEFRKAKHLRAQIACGQKPWDKWVTITSPLHFAETTRLQRLLRFYSVTPVSVFEGVATQIAKIEKLKPDVLDGYSNSLLLLAKEVHRRGLSTIRPRFLVSGAELMDGHSRKFIEERFEAPLYDQYASVEFERMAWQCSERNEYHIDADSVVMQFVDENCEEVAPGEEGEIVCTSLFNYAMPFLRYALDDVGVPSEESDCPCGVTFPLMKVIEGRKNSLLALPEGRVLAPLAFILAIWIFKYYSCIDLFRIKQKRTDLLIFKLKVKDCSVDKRTIERELISHLRRVLEISEDEVTIEVEFVDDIPLDMNGKFKIVVSELDQKQE
jgi:phenylacetate-CoA ligase